MNVATPCLSAPGRTNAVSKTRILPAVHVGAARFDEVRNGPDRPVPRLRQERQTPAQRVLLPVRLGEDQLRRQLKISGKQGEVLF
ncbi:MAG: hypothetical protein II595_09800, partial [Desulfovibrio sp.]|nr:hypothetical protein [Desulfovibrio sp.]